MDFQKKERYDINDLLNIMRLLRSENGCPWDKEQTHESIRKNFIEETYEVCEAIDQKDMSLLKEELGDVLLQVVFHSQMEEEQGCFSFNDVANDICCKLIIRHPHIFSDVQVNGVEDVLSNWNSIKQSTKGLKKASETLDSVPKQLPALMRSQKVQERAGKANAIFGYTTSKAVYNELDNECGELLDAINKNDLEAITEELGDVFFSAVNISAYFKLDAEELLTRSCDKFISRFTQIEKEAARDGIALKDADAAYLDRLWKKAKSQG